MCAGYYRGTGRRMSESHWLKHILFLEALAAVPGMVAAMLRHFQSLRSMQRDQGALCTEFLLIC